MLLGDIGVGKTSLARRLVLDKFDYDYKATIGVDVYTHQVSIEADGKPVSIKLLIWDIDGDFGESIFKQIYIRGATSALVIGDGSRLATLTSVAALGQRFSEYFPGRPISLIINKTDLVAESDLPRLMEPLRFLGAPIVATSAKTGANVQTSFETVARAAYERGL